MLINKLRSYKFFDLSIVDLLGSFIIIYIINLFFFDKKDLTLIFLMVIPFSIIIHYIFDIKTKLNEMIFNKEFNYYKVFVLINLVLLIRTLTN